MFPITSPSVQSSQIFRLYDSAGFVCASASAIVHSYISDLVDYVVLVDRILRYRTVGIYVHFAMFVFTVPWLICITC